MKPTEPDVMKMTHHEREFLLSQIAVILSDLQRLVCQLNSVKIQEESNVKVLCQKVVVPSLNEMSNDVKYSIAFDCNLTTDDDVSSISSRYSVCQHCTHSRPVIGPAAATSSLS